MNKNNLGLVLGPLFFIITIFLQFDGLSQTGKYTLGVTFWMATWWILETVPIAITSLLPLIIFPITGVMSMKETSAPYANPVIFLFIACFMLATAIEKWNLHKRIALNIIKLVGSSPKMIVLGFMLSTGFLSMWLSNTATTIMMLPIGLSLSSVFTERIKETVKKREFTVLLLLAIAYSSSIGGIATLIGTPTNILFVASVSKNMGVDISFFHWFLFAMPPTVLLLFVSWYYLIKVFAISKINFNQESDEDGKDKINLLLASLGKISYEEKTIVIVFLIAAIGWILRPFWLKIYIPNDAIIALIALLFLFIMPSKAKNSSMDSGSAIDEDTVIKENTILDWKTAVQIPWGVVLLFGGGLSLAAGFELSGLAAWIGNNMVVFGILPFILLLLIVVFFVNFLTEITSNVATVSMLLPVLSAMSNSIEVHPYYLMIGATVASSCAFMLPVATAPNAIVYGTGKIKISQMLKAGFGLNFISILIYTLATYYLMPLIFGI